MIPSPWIAVVLTLAAFRLARLLGWDDFPPVARARAWLLGETVMTRRSVNGAMGITNEAPEVELRYRWPTLAHGLHCAYCAGFWVVAAVYGVWVAVGAPGRIPAHGWPFYGLVPFALSAAVGITARILDP